MNSELPKVDITYGTKRHGFRGYTHVGGLLFSFSQKTTSKVTLNSGETFESNIKKISTTKNLIIFSDRRNRISDISYIQLIDRVTIPEKVSTLEKTPVVTNSLKTFHLVLRKAYSLRKDVAVFLKSGVVIKGNSDTHDYDTFSLTCNENSVFVIMYDAVKRIVPLEEDGSLAE
ncbi:hypothetical protein ABZ131_20705 [Providencia rettgeri]